MAGKNLKSCTAALTLALVGYGLMACGDDGGDGAEGPGSDCSTLSLTYANFGENLIDEHCIVCHGTTPVGNALSLDTLEKVRAEADHIIAHAVDLVEPRMPYMLPALPQATRDDLEAWLECGAPM